MGVRVPLTLLLATALLLALQLLHCFAYLGGTRFPSWMLRASVSREESEINALRLFSKLDKDRDGSLSKCEFILGLDSLGDLIDLSSLEAGRLFDKLDVEGLGTVSLEYFCRACSQMRWLRTLSRLVAAVEDHVFAVRDDYNYSNTTTENYGIQPNSFTGEFAGIRANLDYTYHSNYSLERQVWQDFAIKCCLGKTEPHARPWIIYTCGPMGVG